MVGSRLIVDPDVYEFWLNGNTAHEAAVNLQNNGILLKYQATFEDLLSDTRDHYRTFVGLERLLKNPPKLADQQTYLIDPETQRMLIEKYYQFDPRVVREILGKKLSARNRKDLDDVSEKTKVPLRSCRRQFDNIKRVFKTVEEMMGTLVENICSHYLLPEGLARQYAAIVFITNNRFETGKKKLAFLTFEDYVHCANQMITNWSYSSVECTGHEDMDVDLDRDFLQKLRDLKILTEKEYLDEHKAIVLDKLLKIMSDRAFQDLEANFKNVSKTIINIAYGLNHSKDARDIFVDLVEKMIEPCFQSRWTRNDMQHFLTAYKDSCREMDLFVRTDPNLLVVWERYISTLSSCVLQMYHT